MSIENNNFTIMNIDYTDRIIEASKDGIALTYFPMINMALANILAKKVFFYDNASELFLHNGGYSNFRDARRIIDLETEVSSSAPTFDRMLFVTQVRKSNNSFASGLNESFPRFEFTMSNHEWRNFSLTMFPRGTDSDFQRLTVQENENSVELHTLEKKYKSYIGRNFEYSQSSHYYPLKVENLNTFFHEVETVTNIYLNHMKSR